jgi:hypothetical protein
MTEFDLFISLAGIAGVFVGFGSLISATSRSELSAAQLGQIRAAVTTGLTVIVAALIPVGLDRYGVTGHSLWALSSAAFLIVSWAVIILSLRRRDLRALAISQARSSPIQTGFFWLLLELPIQVPLLVTLAGLVPDLEPAFYFTALAFSLFEGAFVLTQFVYSQESP